MAYKYNEVRLEKGLYSEAGKSFEQALETLDPNENYRGTPYENMRMHLQDAIDVLCYGDGNGNAAAAFAVGDGTIGGTAGKLSYAEMLKFWNTFDPYTMNTLLVSPDVMLKILQCAEFQNPLTGLNFQGTGELTNPLGAKLIRSSAMSHGTE